MQLFYNSEIKLDSKDYCFNREESKHIVKVLRKSEGDSIYITDGKGNRFLGTITVANPNKCMVSIHLDGTEPAAAYRLHLGVAPTKANDRFEWFLEKATEIGVTEITPLLCDHSERKTIKLERFEKILQGAMKQSLQLHLPKLNPLTPLEHFLKEQGETHRFIAHCEDTEKRLLKDVVTPQQDTLILIGPEGDFSTREIELAQQAGYTAVSIGETRLRTETAAIVACHTVAIMQ